MAAAFFAAILQNRNLRNLADEAANMQTESGAGMRKVGFILQFSGNSEVPWCGVFRQKLIGF